MKTSGANKFFKEIKRLKDALNSLTSICARPPRPEDVWPFGFDRECKPEDCFKREDGLWEQKERINKHILTGEGTYGYRCIFLWRIKPNYCCAGRPVFDSQKIQEFLDNSEMEKVLHAEEGYEYVWKWYEPKMPTENVWGMSIGECFYVLRKNKVELIRTTVKAEFIRQIKSLTKEQSC